MLVTMNSKEFLKHFIPNNDAKDILETQYVLVSRKIKRMGKYKNTISAVTLYPDNSLLSEYLVDGDTPEFMDQYINQLSDNLPLFATLIKGIIEEKFDIVFLCTKQEEKLGYMDVIRYFISTAFKFPIYEYNYGHIKKHKYEKYDKKKILKKCNKILANAAEEQLKELESTVSGRQKIVSKMSKKEMRKKLKELGIIGVKDMDKSELKDYLEEFYIR